VSDRRLIGKVNATWRGLEGLGRKTERMVEKGATVVRK
jgi:hypothetical protein